MADLVKKGEADVAISAGNTGACVAAAQLTQHPFNRNPVGSGPFKFVEWRPTQSVTLEANPNFPEALGGRPELAGTTLVHLSSPAQARAWMRRLSP